MQGHAEELRGEAKFDSEIGRRRDVSAKMQAIIRRAGLLEGHDLSHDDLAGLIKSQWEIQNLSPITLPRLLGTYHYYRHFKGFEGSPEEFARHMAKQRADWPEGSTGYEGADLLRFSADLRAVLSSEGARFGEAFQRLREAQGVGVAFATGLLALWRPERFGLVNGGSKAPFEKEGNLLISKEQKKRMRERARERFGLIGLKIGHRVMRPLGWMTLFEEIRRTCGFEDFLEVDWLLWRVNRQLAGGGALFARGAPRVGEGSPSYGASASTPPSAEEVEEMVRKIGPEQIEARANAEAKARALIERKLDRLTGEDLRKLLELMNTQRSLRGTLVNGRFGLSFMGRWASAIAEEVEVANRWISALWKTEPDRIDEVLDSFWEAKDLPGGGIGFPTAILFLREPTRWSVYLSRPRKGLGSILGQTLPRGRTSAAYSVFNRHAQKLRETYNIHPSMLDYVLTMAADQSTETGNATESWLTTKGSFKGFTEETFLFLEELERNNRDDWFKSQRERFQTHVRGPLRDLVAEVGQNLISTIEVPLEYEAKSPHTIALPRKNLWGKQETDCYWPHLWAAFHRKETSKTADFQLYIFLRGDYLSYGMSFGSATTEDVERFRQRLSKHAEIAATCMQMGLSSGARWSRDEAMDELLQLDTPAALSEALGEPARGRFNLMKRIEANDPRARGPELASEVEDTFKQLMPLYLLAVSDDVKEVNKYIEIEPESEVDDGAETYPLDFFLSETYHDESFVQEVESLLEDKQQLIFAGPPGTGKTFVAERLARYLAGSEERVELVQFHPSYGYEEFIEGLRPDLVDGNIRYEVKAGIFKTLCDRARRTKQPHVLIIDEINRGNLSRIFGELMYALERRGSEVRLPYSQKPFTVPRNVYVIGTMNTADHSIALVDFALRRRFHFVNFEPDYEVLEQWLISEQPDMVYVKRLLVDLNNELRQLGLDSNLFIGHSHFMRNGLDETLLEQIWERSILPTIEEYFYGQPDKVKRFGFEEFAQAIETVGSGEEYDDVDEQEDIEDDLEIGAAS